MSINELVAAYIAVKDNPTNTYSAREYAGFMLALLGDDAIVACSSRQPWMSDDDWSFRQQAGKVIAAAMQEQEEAS